MGGHPFLADGVDFGDVILAVVLALVALVLTLVMTMLMVWFERKVVGRLQNRIGPNVAGPFGLLQTMADGMKLLFKEDLIPAKADKVLFVLAPFLAVVPAFLTFTVVPIAGDFSNGGSGSSTLPGFLGSREFLWQVADVPIGILFFLAMSSLAVYGIVLAGYGSGSKYPLISSVRATAQAISYEAALGLSLAAVFLVSGALSTNQIVLNQVAEGYGGFNFTRWNVVTTGLIPFIVFLIAATAELNRPPFDLVEAEQELVGGFHTEYSSFRFALFFLAEFMNTVTMGGIIVTLFFGGPSGPQLLPLGAFMGFIWFFLKLMVFLFIFVWFRATLPRVRYDQLMDLGWKVLIPISLAWLLMLGGLQLVRSGDLSFVDSTSADLVIVIALGLAIGLLGYAMLNAAIRTSRSERLAEEGLKLIAPKSQDSESLAGHQTGTTQGGH